jgi:hypothetical protein
MEELVTALENAILLLRKSSPSTWGASSPTEAMELLELERNKVLLSQQFDKKLLQSLFAPTGSIQEISIGNGWGDEFIEISKIVDKYV